MREIETLPSLKDKLFASLSNLSESWMYAVSKIDKFVYIIWHFVDEKDNSKYMG